LPRCGGVLLRLKVLMIRRLVTTVCSLAAGAVLVTAQATTTPPAGAGQGQQAPTFRSRIDSISVDVSVTDQDGRPVPDLKAEDFDIREANKAPPIDTFRLIQVDPTDVSKAD